MKPKRIKIQKTLETSQIADFLRLLASEIEGSGAGGLQDFGVDLHNFNKLKVDLVKREGGQLHLKLKIKDDAPLVKAKKPETEFEDISNTYRPLKKQLAKNFKAIGRTIEGKVLPPAELIETFIKEAEQVVSFTGFGDEYYDEFIKECHALNDEYLKKNIEGIKGHYSQIVSLTRECHRRYK